MTSVLIADDDPHIRELIRMTLRQDRYELSEAGSGTDALRIASAQRIDIAIVDVMMPGIDGLEVCRELKRYYDIPILLLTAKGTNTDKVKGFQAGTDDYVVKPFDPTELRYRMKALLRRFQLDKSCVIEVGALYLNADRTVSIDGTNMILPPKEFELLTLLASHPNRTLTREQLIQQVWGLDYEGDERTVDVHVKRLRERLCSYASRLEIVTVRGLGYKLEVQHD
ncbi:response regulator transcription factor [Paenibacillus tarimensis]|uniref:response regulator transcription factor n=1 Tax=Paenibacillus tarimensis TaxID=416012 RepID=UPI001F45349E|nr:response regulator transcription factor [Paenibacillus tarimensis]MCF2945863.1 response regulator transcription factor [Paenibacillus tarimensis]